MLTRFTTAIKELSLMQTSWAAQLDPILANPTNSSLILQKVELIAGTNTINHKLGQKLQGWKLTRQRAPASIYDAQDGNQRPELTLVLISSAPVVIDLEVF